jgi:hypothetical protein
VLLTAAAERVHVLVVARAARLGQGSRRCDGDGQDGEQGCDAAAGRHGRGL